MYYMQDRPPPKRPTARAHGGPRKNDSRSDGRDRGPVGKTRDAGAGAATPARENPHHALGRLGEQMAAAHLERLGFAIVARNVRTRYGEIDLIAFDGTALVFAEVKTRRARRRWRTEPEEQPLAWLRVRQRLRLRRLAAAWLHSESANRPRAHTIRFDAIGVIVDEAGELRCLDHVESAW
jgi:putative endonuclease